MRKTSLLVIDDDSDILKTLGVILANDFDPIVLESNPDKISYLMHQHQFDVVMLDMNYSPGETSGKEGLSWLRRIKAVQPEANVVVMTAYGAIQLAVEAMKEGAHDFIVKPWDWESLKGTLDGVLHKQQIGLTAKKAQHFKHTLVGNSAAMNSIFQIMEKVAKTEANILILGENGTGKELVAEALHHNSNRKEHAFVKVDLGALSENLFESELFGHKKGAFTDAKEDKLGLLGQAQKGTLFLDEIANIPIRLQNKLLSVLQNRRYTPVGATESLEMDVRLISATNERPDVLVVEGSFRQDLLYRINTIEIEVPNLRSRKEDIPLLVAHFLKIYSQQYSKGVLQLNEQAINYLKEHPWPGNVRELQHSVERAVILASKNSLSKSDFYLGPSDIDSNDGSLNLDQIEKTTMIKALKQHQGNISKAAKELGLGRTTMYRKMEKYGLQ